MKHKLKLSFWALGILVLVLSQLFILAPAPKAFAATSLFDDTKTNTYNFSVYTAFRTCLSGLSSNSAIDPSSRDMNFLTNTTAIVGFAGSDGNNEDGQASCAETLNLWKSIAGYADVTTVLSELGFQKGAQACQTSGTTSTSQTCVDTWVIGSGGKNSILDKQASIAKSKNIPTSLPTWGRYMLAYTALQAKCSSTPTNTGPAQTSTTTGVSTKVVADNTGALTAVTYYPSTSESVSTFPGQKSDSSCKYLIDVMNDASVGAAAFSTAIINNRIDSTVSIAETAICDKLGLTGKAKDNCEIDFNGYIKACIDTYYKGNAYASAVSRAQPFDPTFVAECVEGKAKSGGYTILASEISAILSDAQDQTTPDDTSATTNTDPCAVLGNDVPMRWLACALLTAGAGAATVFYNMVQTLLYMPTSSIFTQNFTQVASTFRIIGMALIIIAGLIMIIAQATGSDLVDAYTIKKVLPKLGIALVGMAVALPLLKFAVNITNDLGIAAGDVIVRLGGSGAGGASATITDNIGAIFLGLAGVTVAGVVWGWAALTFIGTAALGLLIGVIVLAVRQMAIIVLIMIAPLAIAASVLPGTDKLWKFWRSTLLSTLMMFPIIMMFLKAGEFMAGIFASMATTENNGLFTVLGAIIYFAPYFMIPLAFKMAGGLISTVFGMMNDRGKGLFDRMSKFRSGYGQTHRERTVGRQMLSARADMQRGLKRAASGMDTTRFGGRIGSRVLRGMGAAVGGYNLEAQVSQRQAAVAKEVNDQIATGVDDEIRGLSVDKRAALQKGKEGVDWQWKTEADGSRRRQFRTLGGAWVDEAAVDEGHRRWGRDHFAQQAALSYEMRKANSEEDVERISSGYRALAKDAWGMTDTEASGAWIGAAFENQSQHIEFKKTDWGTGDVNYDSLADEIYEKKGSYPLAQMHSRTIERLKQGYKEAQDVVNAPGADSDSAEYKKARERMMKIEAITETFMSEFGGSGGIQYDDKGQPIAMVPPTAQAQRQQSQGAGQAGSQQPYRTANTPGAAHVAERVQELAVLTGAFNAAPSGTYDTDTHAAAPTRTVKSDGTTINLDPNNQGQNRP